MTTERPSDLSPPDKDEAVNQVIAVPDPTPNEALERIERACEEASAEFEQLMSKLRAELTAARAACAAVWRK